MTDTRVSDALRKAADALDDRGEGPVYGGRALNAVKVALPIAEALERDNARLREALEKINE